MFLDPIFRMTSTAPHAVSCIMALKKSGQGGKRTATVCCHLCGCWARVKDLGKWDKSGLFCPVPSNAQGFRFPIKGQLA